MPFRSFPPRGLLSLLLCFLTAGSLTAAAQSTTTLALRAGGAVEQPHVEVLASDQHSVRLVIDLPALAIDHYDIGGQDYQTVAVEGGQLHGDPGAPALPAFTRYVSIPATAGVALQVVSVEEETFSSFLLLPMQEDGATSFQRNEQLYSRDEFLGDDPITIGAPSLMRDLRVVPVTFHPVRFNPVTREIRVVRRVELALTYAGVDLRSAKERPTVPLTKGFDQLYRSVVVNYDPETYYRSGEVAPHLGTWLLLSREDATLIQKLQPLIEWRRAMGYNVVHVTTTTTGSSPTGIRTWLQNAYNTWEDPPEYICIVGDATGTFAIGTFNETWTYYSGEGDHPYSQLTGDDLMPDAFIGRLSAEDYTTIERVVNKITGYEQTPFMTDTSWFGRACLTGDPSYSGITCVQIMQWLKEQLRQIGYAQVDTVFTYPYESRTISLLNAGNTFFGYRGYYQMSGISSGDIAALANGWKLTYAINLTCGTGSWRNGTSHNEAWLRGGSGTSNASGGIGSIGTATTGTATRYNNCFFAGAAYGMFWGDDQRLGHSHARGKIEMILNYEAVEYSQAGRYCYWNTLMGDPATDMWTGVPAQLNVTYPASVPVGANVVSVNVRRPSSLPVEGAWVYLRKADQIHIGGYTDAAGTVALPIDTSSPGEVSVVVTGHNLYAYQGSFEIAPAAAYVGLHEYRIDDSADGGNGDGQLNPGEEIQLYITLRNFGPQTASDVRLRLGTSDPYVGLLGDAELSFGNMTGYSIRESTVPLRLRLYPGTPPGHVLAFSLTIICEPDAWQAALDIPTSGPNLVFQSAALTGAGTQLDPGESADLQVALKNYGAYAGQGPISAMLASDSYSVQVIDAAGSFNTIPPGATGMNTFDAYRITSPSDCIPGQLANLRLVLVCADGVRQTVPFTLPVGTANSNEPTGPDAYGYWCYDQTDTDYADAPTYQWIDINPASGGPGTSADLNDFSANGDDSRTLDLPFTFVFYGQPFDRVTICSNGWMAMGHTYLTHYRNWHLPSAGGPANMIAAFWDNLYQSGTNKVYYWSDAANHRFVVAWDMVRNDYGGGVESFEIILYDPAYYPTQTGDSIVDVMYEQIQDTDSEQMYSTAGIQNADHSTGITFCYFRQRPATAAAYVNGLALRYTTNAPGFAGVGGDAPSGQTRLLLRNEPNPWSGDTTIRFQLAQPEEVRLRIFDLDGRLVRTLHQGALPAGPHALDWSGTNEAGLPLPAGVYYYRLETGAEADTRPMLLMR